MLKQAGYRSKISKKGTIMDSFHDPIIASFRKMDFRAAAKKIECMAEELARKDDDSSLESSDRMVEFALFLKKKHEAMSSSRETLAKITRSKKKSTDIEEELLSILNEFEKHIDLVEETITFRKEKTMSTMRRHATEDAYPKIKKLLEGENKRNILFENSFNELMRWRMQALSATRLLN